MEALPSDLSARIQQLEGRLVEPSVKAEFSMLVGELVLSVKTLELELKAERTKSEAMRHNLRALATAVPAITPRGQEANRALHSNYKNAVQVPKQRFLEEGGNLHLRYQTFRGAAPTPGSSTENGVNKRLQFSEQRSRSNTSIAAPQQATSFDKHSSSPKQSTATAHSKPTLVSIKPQTRINQIFAEPVAHATVLAEPDEIDLFNLDDILIDSPFDSAPGDSSLRPGSSVSKHETTSVRDPSPIPKRQNLNPSPPILASSSAHEHVQVSEIDNSSTDQSAKSGLSAEKLSPRQESEKTSPNSSKPPSLRLEIPANNVGLKNQSENGVASPLSPSSPVDFDIMSDEGISTVWILEMLQQAMLDGKRQKIELEKTRKQLIVQNMQAPSPASMVTSVSSDTLRPEPSSSTTAAESKPSSLKMRFSMKRLRQKPLALSVSHPVGLKVGSYRAEQDEFERIFYLTKDFVDPPTAAQRVEEAKLPAALRRKIGILKESLDYDVDFSNCEIYAIPAFVLDCTCKTTRFSLADNKISEIPNQIRKFDKLEEFNLANNLLVRVPGAIGHLKVLRAINFTNNKISEIPIDMAYLPQLEFLDLSENQITEVPKHIGWLQGLKHFTISKNPISSLPSELALCTRLTHLEASTCFIKKVPKELVCLVELEVLDLSHNALKELPASMGLMVKLVQLHISNNQLTDLPVSLGMCAQLMSVGKFDHSPNPWNPKVFSMVLSGETSMVDHLLGRVLANQKALSKLAPLQPPKLPSIPIFKPLAVDTERWTMQEKILCLGDWVTHTIDNYMKPALRNLYDLLSSATDLESPALLRVVQLARQLKTLIWRSEDILKPAPFATARSFENDDPLTQIKVVLTGELMALDAHLRSLLPIIRTAAINEKIVDTVNVVNIVHFIRDLLFILVLEESRGPSVNSISISTMLLSPRSTIFPPSPPSSTVQSHPSAQSLDSQHSSSSAPQLPHLDLNHSPLPVPSDNDENGAQSTEQPAQSPPPHPDISPSSLSAPQLGASSSSSTTTVADEPDRSAGEPDTSPATVAHHSQNPTTEPSES
jgi:Leucine-rich repeat (LRR) protein